MATICKYYQTGYCKFQSSCKNQHVDTVCVNINCNDSSCQLRHPQVCKFSLRYGRCKFGNNCAYLHLNILEFKQKLQFLENEIEKINNKIVELESVRYTAKEKEMPTMVTSLPTKSIITVPSSSLTKSQESYSLTKIPQFDGLSCPEVDQSSHLKLQEQFTSSHLPPSIPIMNTNSPMQESLIMPQPPDNIIESSSKLDLAKISELLDQSNKKFRQSLVSNIAENVKSRVEENLKSLTSSAHENPFK